MKGLRSLRNRKPRDFWRSSHKAPQRGDKWPAWKKDVRIARYISLLK